MISIMRLLRPRIRPRWFTRWNAELDAALDVLPESECCSRELYRLVCTNQDPLKTFAVVEESEEPIGVVCLRRRETLHDWVPVTHYSIPGMIFPTKEGSLGKVLSVLHRNVRLAWWRMGESSSDIVGVISREVVPTYGIDLTGDYEKYWREYSHLNTVKRDRGHCKDFEVRISGEGMTEWVIRSWERKWRETPTAPRADLQDKISIAEHLERQAKNFTFTLHDSGRPMGGHTFLVHEKFLVWQYTYRDPQYDKLGVGTYLMDVAIKWAIESGFTGIDLGGDHAEHKKRWGPIVGHKTSMHICPRYLRVMRRGQEILGHVRANGLRQSLKTAMSRILINAKSA